MITAPRPDRSATRLIALLTPSRPDLDRSEWQQALIRTLLALIVAIYLGTELLGENLERSVVEAGLIVSGYLGVSLLTLLTFSRWPGSSPLRRWALLIGDLTVTTYVAARAGEALAPFFGIYLWITIGYAVRYGQRYLLAATALGSIGFAVVITTNAYWLENRLVGIGLLLTLLIIPAFVGVLLRQRERAREAAEAANRAKGQFLENMSHEIRTPLTGIIGLAELLGSSGLDPERHTQVATLRSSAQLLLSLVDDVLDVEKLGAGKLRLERVPFDLHALAERVLGLVRANSQAKRLELWLDLDPRVPFALQGDPHRLEQVLLNLLGNAIKFTDTGYVALRIRLRALDGTTARVRLEVSDTGIGIEHDRQREIFERFAQADVSTTRRFGGSGLGTTIAKGLVEQMGGQIGLESTVEAGSTFWLQLSLALQAGEFDPQIGLKPVLPLRLYLQSDDTGVVACVSAACVRWGISFQRLKAVEEIVGRTGEAERAIVLVDPGAAPGQNLPEPGTYSSEIAWVLLCRDPEADTLSMIRAGYDLVLPVPLEPRALLNALHALGTGPARERVRPAPAEVEAVRGRGTRILLAEDHPTNQLVIASFLRQAGYEPVIAGDGVAALERLRRERFDAAVVDLQMPKLGGLGVIEAVRTARSDRLPIVVLTANATAQAEAACRAAGADAFLTKPILADTLLQALDTALGRAPQRLPDPATTHVPPDDSPSPATERAGIDVAWLDMLAAAGGGVSWLQTFFLSFADRAPGLLDDMQTALGQRDLPRYREIAHRLKGAAATVGAKRTAALAGELADADDALLGAEGDRLLDLLRVEVEIAHADFAEALANPARFEMAVTAPHRASA